MRALQLKASIPEIVGHRDAALAKLNEAISAIKDAYDHVEKACPGSVGAHGLTSVLSKMVSHGRYNPEALRVIVDRNVWRGIMINSPLWSLMDKTARDELESSLNSQPPEATVDNIRATVEEHFANAETMFNRGLVTAFQSLSQDYASHDGLKIGKRVVLSYVQSSSGGLEHRAADRLRDIDRVFHVLDGKPYPDAYGAGIVGALEAAFQAASTQGKAGSGTAESDYFTARFCKNGNVHLHFKRRDLTTHANHIIAEHFGATLGRKSRS